MNRRRAIGLLAALAASTRLGACSSQAGARVVLYSSADDPLVREVVGAFTRKTGLKVAVVGDTEATKTTGLVARLEAEKSAPRADVWWSSEVLGSVKLARSGVLEAYHSPEVADATGAVAWPIGMYARDFAWTGLACRARVIAYSTRRLPSPPPAVSAPALLAGRLGVRVGIAHPEFGTTRSHIAALVDAFGVAPVEEMLRAGKRAGLKLYDGNASVVRAIAQGEIDAGLTDSDDAWAAVREGWPVGMAYEAPDPASTPGVRAMGPLLLPNSVGLVRGAPNGAGARKLIDFLLSAEGESIIARSESRNAPVRPALASAFPDLAYPRPWIVDWEAVEKAGTEAMAVCARALA